MTGVQTCALPIWGRGSAITSSSSELKMTDEARFHVGRCHRRSGQVMRRAGTNEQPCEARSAASRGLQPAAYDLDLLGLQSLRIAAGGRHAGERYQRRHRPLPARGIVDAVIEQQM